jgi:serine/threonine-protein kinase
MLSSEQPLVSGGLAPGSHVAGYRIEEQIGRGGMAVVYRATDVRLNRSVALKILAPELAGDTAFRQRFIREMRSAAAVDHPNIVPVFDAGEADGRLFIAMRYVSGQDGRTLLDAERTLAPARVVHLITQVASALDDAHAGGLVHRDVKPGNMLISAVPGSDQPDHVYLSDFGLSKEALSSSLTLTGQFLGTLDYMAPEQVEGHPIDGRADLYALACTAFEMLAGAPPFKRDAGLAVLWAQLSEPAPSLIALRPDLPPAVDQVIARALAKSPDDRYANCAAFAAALRAGCGLTASSGPDGGPGAGAAPAGPPPTQRAHVAEPHPVTSHPQSPAGQAGPGGSWADGSWADDPPTDPRPGPAVPWANPAPAPQQSQAASWTAARPQDQAASWTAPGPQDQPASWAAPGPQDQAASWEPPTQQSQGASWAAPRRPSPPRPQPQAASWAPSAQQHPAESWPSPPPSVTPGRYQPGRPPPRRSGRRAAGVLIGCLVIVVIAAVAFLLLHGKSSPGSPAGQPSSHPSQAASAGPPAPLSPAATVQAYFAAINAHDYGRAWDLGGKNTGSSYSKFKSGFSDTASDDLTVVSVAGDVVTVRLDATQTNGSVHHFQGTYTVSNGVITQSQIQSAG